MAGHSSSNFVCRICKDDFANQTILDQHFSDLHPTKTSHHCDTCNEDFISELFLKIHVTEYHSTPNTTLPKRNSKSLVGTKSVIRNKSTHSKRFNNSGYLKKIVCNTLVRTNNLFWCPVCFESFGQRENLRDHFRSSHVFASGSVYVCELCDIEKPSAEILCWHLEVHSNNRLSVNRFSKLRTCVSSIKKENTENYNNQLPQTNSSFQSSVTDGCTTKTKSKINDLKRLKRKESLYTGNSRAPETELKTGNIPTYGKKELLKENIVQKVSSGKLKFLHSKKQKILHSKPKSIPPGRSKSNRLASKNLQVKITSPPRMMKDDEITGNSNIEVMATKTAEDESLQKLEGNAQKCNQGKNERHRAKVPQKMCTSYNHSDHDNYGDEDGLISDQLLCGDSDPLEVESTNVTIVTQLREKIVERGTNNVSSSSKTDAHHSNRDNGSENHSGEVDSISDNLLCGDSNSSEVESTVTTVVQPSEKIVDHETINLRSQIEANVQLTDDSQSPVEAATVELSVNSHQDKGENVSSDIINKSTPETSFDTPEKQSTVVKSMLSKKGKSRFRNLRSSCPTKGKKMYIINTKKTIKSLMIHKDSNPLCDIQERNKMLMHDKKPNLTVNVESSLVSIADVETLHLLSRKDSDNYLHSSNIKESSQFEIKRTSPTEDIVCKGISNENPVEVPEDSKITHECQNIASNATNKNVSSELSADGFKNKTKATSGSYKDSTTFHKVRNSYKTESLVSNSSKKLESDYSDKVDFWNANSVVLQAAPKKIDSEYIFKEGRVKKPGKSSSVENLQGSSGKPELNNESEENALAVPTVLENILEEQNDKPIEGCPSSLQGNETEITSLHLNDKEDDQNTENSNIESNELFEEVTCDKCSLKFYNQDDLFDHIGLHYDI